MTSTAPAETGGKWQAVEQWLIVLIAFHSAAIGLAALVATDWGVRFSGFEGVSPLFFPRQVGIFHVVVALAYLIEWFRYRGVAVLLATKTIAVVFLTSMLLVDRLPWVVPLSAVGDGLMGLAVLLVHLRARGSALPVGAGR
jgi:hypothetical protein